MAARETQSWRHSGFSIDAGEAPLAADDAAGRRRLAEYLLRAPFSLEKITYNAAAGSVFYRSERHWLTKRNFGGYTGALVAWVRQLWPRRGTRLQIVKHGAKLEHLAVLPKRWIVERTFAWLGRSRRLSKDYEHTVDSSKAFIYLAMIRLMLRRLA